MLQFLLADYLPGYRLPSLRKTVTVSDRITWTLTSRPNRYALLYLYIGGGATRTTLVDECHCKAVAIRLYNGYVLSLLEDGSERIVNGGVWSTHDKIEVMREYLIDEE